MELAGKTVFITGAAKRIGRAIAHGFADKGSDVLVHYHHSEQEAQQLVEELTAKGIASRAYSADLCTLSSLQQMAKKILEDFSTIDVLVNNASRFYPTPFESTTEAQWDEFLTVHVKAPFFLAQQFGPIMKAKGEGRIINIADWSGMRPRKNYVAYSTSKAALLAMTKGLAKELAPEVLVTAVCPGPILPPPGMNAAEHEAIQQQTLLKRWGSPEDIVRQILFLAEQDYATGGAYLVDGGQLFA